MLELKEFTYRFKYIKKDNTSGTVHYTVMAISDDEGRYKAADKFRLDRESLINT